MVESGTDFDVVGDIGDVDPNFGVAVRKFTEGNSVVEITSGVGIDGDDEFSAEILAAWRVVRQFHFGIRGGLGDGFGRKLGGKIKLSDDRKNVHAGIGVGAETLHDDTLGVGVAVFPLNQTGDDFVAGLGGRGALGSGGGDVKVVQEAGVVRDDDMKAGGFLEGADDVGGASLQNAKHASATPFGSIGATTSGAGGLRSAIQPRHNQITVQGVGGVLSGDVEVGRSILG